MPTWKQASDTTADRRAVQCGECFKWRIIPTQEEYEEIRSKFIEDPFVCSQKPGISCDDPTDIEYDNSRTWRRMVMRKDCSKMDCYYDTPNGKKLRASTEVPKFLDKNPEYKKDLSAKDFSFTSPKIMEYTLPANVAKD
ncbi:hypothetical protein Pfo_030831 [Paulownia fortunei]|nr:hypothetical protein Pfo_030831 [Paulownia fortunei]